MNINIGFLQPYYFLALIVLAISYKKILLWQWQKFKPILKFRYPLVTNLSTEPIAKGAKNYSFFIVVLLLILALSQPVIYSKQTVQVKTEPVDIIIAMSTAISMVLKDYTIENKAVSRLFLAKHLLNDFVKSYSGKKLGLVLLSNPPMLWLPYTADKKVFIDAVNNISTSLGGRLSDLGGTLALINKQFSGATDKVVVLITDGGLQVGETAPIEVAKKLKKVGFSIYIIALGAEQEQQSDKAGLIFQPVQLAPLKLITQAGGGKLFHVKDKLAFKQALKYIEEKHRKPIIKNQRQHVEPLFSIFLLMAMVIVLWKSFFKWI